MKHDFWMIIYGLKVIIKHGMKIILFPIISCMNDLAKTPIFTFNMAIIYTLTIIKFWSRLMEMSHPLAVCFVLLYAMPIVLYLSRLALDFIILKIIIPALPTRLITQIPQRLIPRNRDGKRVIIVPGSS